ncbi:UNVERIFIED_CONTAM: hypothetical protein RMT77_019502 [Armadillidium vulgare]
MASNEAFVSSEDGEENEKESSHSSHNNDIIKSENCVIENLNSTDEQIILYASRWGFLFAAFFSNMSSGTLFSDYSPVATDVADYYGKAPEDINWFSLMYMFFAIPGSFYGTYIVDRWGLKPTLWIGCSLNMIGALIRALSTSSVFTDDRNAQFAISISGQVLCANAQCFIIFMSTKISQCWFPESQRGICTTILATANPIGVVVAQISVPLIVEDAEDIPLNDLVFLGIAIANVCIMFIFVRRSNPPTPPSYSADASKESRPPYLEQLKSAFTCFPYLLLLFAIGGGIGLTVSLATLTEQMLCPLGYTEVFSGITIALMFLFGFCGAVVAAILLDRTKMYTEITIYFFGAAALSAIVLFEVI